jgi:predicted GNAT superfamily acetyltransferase
VALWDLEAPYVRDAAAGRRPDLDVNVLLRAGAEIGLHTDGDGRPLASPVPAGVATVLVQIPDDIQQLRRTDPLLASRWRATSREVLEPLLAGPYVTTGFTRTGWYVLEETPA